MAFGLWLCLASAVDAAAQTPSSVAPGGAAPGRSATPVPASSIPTLEAVATAPLACGGDVSWTEDKAISRTGRAQRVGDRLRIGSMTFIDRPARNGREPSLYLYVGLFGMSGLDLVQVQHRDGASFLLVDGARRSSVEMSRFPVPSPSGRYFAVAAPPAGDAPGGVEIVERTTTGVRSVATVPRNDLVDDPCRLTNLTWQSDERFSVQARRPGGKAATTIIYGLDDGKWKQIG